MSRVCILSLRAVDIRPPVTMNAEFEDVIADVDDVEVVLPGRQARSPSVFRVLDRAAVHSRLLNQLNPGFRVATDPGGQDLAVMIVNELDQLVVLNAMRGWRRRVGKAICVIREAWRDDLPRKRGAIALLNQFDHVFCEYRQSIDDLQALIDVPCTYIATGIDTIRFCPLPHLPQRTVDVYNIGRRVGAVHKAFLSERERTGLFYFFSSIQPEKVWNPTDHRVLLADVLKRSRYAVVKRAKFDETDQQEIGFRYFEGAASGAVMVGERVDNDAFPQLFDWPDAVVESSDDEVLDHISELNSQPERVATIRRENVKHMLRRHDCAHRWEQILETVGMQTLPRFQSRRQRLDELAEDAERTIS